MPFYYFHLQEGREFIPDLEGCELRDVKAAAETALKEARAIIGEDTRTGSLSLDKAIEVENAAGDIVHRLIFTDAVQIIWP